MEMGAQVDARSKRLVEMEFVMRVRSVMTEFSILILFPMLVVQIASRPSVEMVLLILLKNVMVELRP